MDLDGWAREHEGTTTGCKTCAHPEAAALTLEILDVAEKFAVSKAKCWKKIRQEVPTYKAGEGSWKRHVKVCLGRP